MRPPRILLCFNPFKGTLSAAEANAAAAAGLRASGRRLRIASLAAADGGPGTLAALKAAVGGRWRRGRVQGPLGPPLRAAWLDLGEDAVIESALAIGLERVPLRQRDALRASSEGLGQLLRAVARAGKRRVWVGLGGSASTDGGSGLARALGWRFLDAAGRELPPGGGALARLERIVAPLRSPLGRLRIEVLCDVDNPLLGPQGAARVYAPQKGADAAQVRALERGLARLAFVVGGRLAQRPGSGAAGGLGWGLQAFAGAALRPGAETLLDLAGLPRRLAAADFVLTGEGRLDAQSLRGKLPTVLAARARRADKACVALCGQSSLSAAQSRRAGFSQALCAPGRDKASARRALRAAARDWARGLPA